MSYIIKKAFTLLVFPVLLWSVSVYGVSAQLDGINDSISTIGTGVNGIIIILISGIFLFFVYNLIHMLLSPSDETKKKVLWSVIAMFLVTSIWGITNLLGNALSIDSSTSSPIVNPLTFGQ